MKAFLVVIAVAALLVGCSFPAVAQEAPKEYPIVSLARLAIAGGVQYDWRAGDSAPVPSEFAAGVHAGYVLTTHLSLAGHAVYGADSHSWRVSPAVHYRIPDGITKTGSVAFGLAYDYYAGEHIPPFPHEWSASAIWAMPLTQRVLIGASESYSFDNREWRTSVGIHVPLWFGRES